MFPFSVHLWSFPSRTVILQDASCLAAGKIHPSSSEDRQWQNRWAITYRWQNACPLIKKWQYKFQEIIIQSWVIAKWHLPMSLTFTWIQEEANQETPFLGSTLSIYLNTNITGFSISKDACWEQNMKSQEAY